jgi:hypothetical protein
VASALCRKSLGTLGLLEESPGIIGAIPLPEISGQHVGVEDGVDAGLVSALATEPAEQVGVEADVLDSRLLPPPGVEFRLKRLDLTRG